MKKVDPLVLLAALAVAGGLVFIAVGYAANAEDVSTPCQDEITGEAGLKMMSGECITPAEYDEIFSPENLAATPHQEIPGKSVAEVYGITPDGPKASERPRDFMGEDLGTFADAVILKNGLIAL